MRKLLKILILEDNSTDAEMIGRLLLKEELNCEFKLAMNKSNYLDALDEFQPDIILSDHSLPQFDSASALTIARQRIPGIPFIMVTGAVSEEFAADIIKKGADDYILKDRLTRLPAAIEIALKRHQAEKEKLEAEKRVLQSEVNLRAIFENTSEGFLLLGKNCIVKAFNKKSEEYAFFASEKKMRTGESIYEYVEESRKDFFKGIMEKVLDGETVQYERFHEGGTGNARWIDFSITPVIETGQIDGICITGKDITEKKLAEQQKEFDSNNLRALINNTQDLMWSVDRGLKLVTFNESFSRIIELTTGKSLAKGDYILSDQFTKAQRERYYTFYQRALSGETFSVVDRFDQPFEFWTEISFYPIRKGEEVIGTACFSRDITKRKKDEEIILKSEEQYRDLVDNISDLICTHDLEGNILSMNRAAEKLTGLKLNEYQTMNIKNFLLPGEKNKFDNYIKDIQKNGFSKGVMKVKTPSGDIRTWEYSNSLKTYRVVTPVVRGYARDITESKNAQRKIRFDANLLKAVGQAVIATDINGLVTYWNNAAEKIYGWSAGEVMGKNIIELTPAKESKEKAVEIMKELGEGRLWNGELLVRRKDGSIFPAFLTDSPIYNDKGEAIGVIGVSVDISERKKAEKEIADYKNALDQSAIISITDQNGKIKYVNENFCRISGYSAEELLEQDHRIINSGYHPKAYIKNLWSTIGQGKIWRGEFCNKAKDGSLYWVDATIVPFVNNKGKPVQYLAIRNDITARKVLEKEVMDQKLQAQKKITRAIIKAQEKERNRMGQELHDNVNQILAGTKMYIGMIGKDEKSKASIKYPLELIDSAIHEIRALSSKSVTPLKNIDLKEMLQLLVNNLDNTTSIRSVLVVDVINEDIDDDIKLNIYRIVQEQVNNIIKHAEAKNVTLAVKAKEQVINIVITDDGKGFDVKKKRKGIGISNMINRIESFNGNIKIESAPGNGSTVEIQIPY